MMTIDERANKAHEIKSLVDTLKPVTAWGFTSRVWISSDCRLVRVYINDKKRNTAAVLSINEDGNVTGEWQPGHSMTRNEIRAAMGL